MAFHFEYPNPPADERGWGPGWPNCQTGKMVPVAYPSFQGSALVRQEVHELLIMLLTETEEALNYRLDGPVTDDWAFSCRPTKRSDGTLTNTPSNHSWGLAVDLNATQNVFGGGHDMPQRVVDLWHTYGWRWLGPPIKDWEHFDFCGTPADAAAMTDKARRDGIGMALTPAQQDKLNQAAADAAKAVAFVEAAIAALGANTAPGAGTRVGNATEKVEAGGPAPVAGLVPHTHPVPAHGHTVSANGGGTSGPAAKS